MIISAGFRAVPVRADYSYSVVFWEINWAGSSVSTADEWVVLRNLTSQNIDLSGWKIVNLAAGNKPVQVTIPSDQVIPASGYFLIANNGPDHQFSGGQSVLNLDPDLIDSGLSLSNSNFGLGLFNAEDFSNSNSIDLAGDGEDPVKFAGSKESPKKAMRRIEPIGKGNEKASWQTATDAGNLDQGVLDVAWPKNSGKQIIKITSDPITLGLTVSSFQIQILEPVDTTSLKVDSAKIDTDASQCEIKSNQIVCQLLSNLVAGEHKFDLTLTDQVGLPTSFTIVIRLFDELAAHISEIYSAPASGQPEWIELYNPNSRSINLYLWRLDDMVGSGSSPFEFEDFILEPGQYRTVESTQTKLVLNNSGDDLNLINPSGTIKQTVTIPALDASQSLANFSDGFKKTTTSTPGALNQYTSDEIDESVISAGLVSILDVDQYLNQIVTVEGEIVENDGPTIWLESGGSRLKVYLQAKRGISKPTMKIGDHLKVTGLVDQYRGQFRLLPRTADDIIITLSAALPASPTETNPVVKADDPLISPPAEAPVEDKTLPDQFHLGDWGLLPQVLAAQSVDNQSLSISRQIWFDLICGLIAAGMINLWLSIDQKFLRSKTNRRCAARRRALPASLRPVI